MSRSKVVALAALVVAGVLAIMAYGSLTEAPAQRAVAAAARAQNSAIPQVTVTLSDDHTETPATVPTGMVAVRYTNAGSAPLSVTLVQLTEGATVEDLRAAFATEGEAAFDRFAAAGLGGPGVFPPGAMQEFVHDLAPGAYVIASFPIDEEESGDGGAPDAATLAALFRPGFTAVPPPTATEPPSSAGTIELGDFFFRAPAIPAGTNTFAVTNAGEQLHHLIVFKLAEGLSFADIEAMFAAGEDPFAAGLLESAPGVSELTPGATAWPTLSFTPGNYAMLCFIEDPATGLEHADLGMVQPFTVP
ncbi:MAG: hypothetical protein ACRDJE_05520 [Dehalococcoidia bacterium]